MSTSNPWLTPYQRSFNTIKAKLIQSLRERVPEITDFSEGNIFILILSMFAAMAEVLHYYIDNMAREAFLPTARRYTSLYNHAKLVDYHIKSAIPASVDIVIFSDSPVDNDITIPVNTEFRSTDNKIWLSSKTVVLTKGTKSVKVPLVQKSPVGTSRINLGTIKSYNDTIGIIGHDSNQRYVEGSMNLFVNGEPWTLVNTFAYSRSGDKVYKVEMTEDLIPTIVFGDGRFGMQPPLNATLEGFYHITYGEKGNLPEGSFSSIPSIVSNQKSNLKISANSSANGGSNYENFDMLKEHIPLSIKTLGVAITKEDYEAVTKLIPGVNKAYVNYICGKYVEIYITPDNPNNSDELGWGQASEALIDEVNKVLSKAKVITTNIYVGSTHAAKIFLEAEVTGKKSFNSSDISDQVISALLESYNYNTSDINKPIRLSDLYSLIDNLSLVDYLEIKKLYLLPYPKPVISSSPELVVSSFTQNYFKGESKEDSEEYMVTFNGNNSYTIVSKLVTNKVFKGTLGSPLLVNGSKSEFSITIGNSTSGLVYNEGDSYTLIIQNMNTDLIPKNYNIPIFSQNSIQLTINEVV